MNKKGEVKIFSVSLRMSSNRSFLDSSTYGGLQIGVDLKTGLLKDEAFADFDNGFVGTFNRHPLTRVLFKGFEVPFFHESCQLAINASKLIPELKIIGWDVAITSNGPIILEGNNFPGISFSEISQGGFKNNVFVQEIINENHDRL